MYRNNRLSSETAGCLLLIFAAVIVLVSGYSSVTNAVSYFKNRSAWKKTETVCTEKATGSVIDDSEAYIKIHPMFNITNHQYYCADIQYTVNGETYNGSSGWSQLHDLRSGDRVTIMYDPKDPNWSYCADYPSVKMEAEINLRRALTSAAWIGVVLVLFAVYDSQSGNPDYIPPEYSDVPNLLDELVAYVNTTDDHPLLVAAVVHYQLVTIHPFEDGNGRTARLLSGYILDINGYGFYGIGSLEEYFAYDINEYYESIQMGLPALYYLGRNNPPHPEIWFHYFLRMVMLYSNKVCELSESSSEEELSGSLSYLKAREKELLLFLIKNYKREFTPIEVSRELGVTNKTVINRLAVLVKNGFVVPVMAKERIRSYKLSDFAKMNEKEIKKMME